MNLHKAIFLDKDGTLINDIPYNVDPQLITLSHNCIEGLQLLQQESYLLVIVSNQSGVALGYFKEPELKAVELKLNELLSEHQIMLNGFYYCPHHPEGNTSPYNVNCNCRKPMPGMLLNAAHGLQIDLHKSWMIGDILNDIEAGNLAGCRSLLIDNGNETEWVMTPQRKPEKKVKNINEAAYYILKTVSDEEQLAAL